MANQFPDPSITPDYVTSDGAQYYYDSVDGKWIPSGFVDPVLPNINYDDQQTDTIDDRYANVLGETLTGHLNVLEPVEDLNAVSKGYVDNVTTGDYLEHDGDTMKGYLEVPIPSEENQVVNIEYLNSNGDDKVWKTGDEMTGTLSFESDPTEPEPVVYKFNPSIVELTERPGSSVTTTLDLGTDKFYINTFVELKDTGEFTFSSPVLFTYSFIVEDSNVFNLNNLLEVHRGTEDHITYGGPISFNTEIITKEYVDNIYKSLVYVVPIGTIFFWISRNSVPEGYFELNGASFDINAYPELHTYLQGTDGYSNGRLPDFKDRFACHLGDPNDGVPGEKLDSTNAFTGTTDSKGMTMTAHTHGYTIGTGTHTHTSTISNTGTNMGPHGHTYHAWGTNMSGNGTGSSNPTDRDNNYKTDKKFAQSTSHTHTFVMDSTDHRHTTHTVSIGTKTNIGTHTHIFNISNPDTTTRPLGFLGYWIIKNK